MAGNVAEAVEKAWSHFACFALQFVILNAFNVITTSYIATSLCEHKDTSSFTNWAHLCFQYATYHVLAASASYALRLLVLEMSRSTYSVVKSFTSVTPSI